MAGARTRGGERLVAVTMRPPRRTSRSVAIYAVAWLAATAVVVTAVLLLSHRHGPSTVTVPPLSETRLDVAARKAGCRLVGARAAARAGMPVTGPATSPASRPRVYERRPAPAALLAALRRGTIVIEFGRLPDEVRSTLEAAQSLVPAGTILAPGRPGMPYAVAARAYRHLLACPRFGAHALDALRLFRGRFVGVAPGPG